MFIYHITTNDLWESQKSSGAYTPVGYQNDGFIHCSTVSQVHYVASRFYHGQPGLIILEIDTTGMGDALVFENLEGGSELFPHIYSPIAVSSVHHVYGLKLDSDRSFVFPPPFSPSRE